MSLRDDLMKDRRQVVIGRPGQTPQPAKRWTARRLTDLHNYLTDSLGFTEPVSPILRRKAGRFEIGLLVDDLEFLAGDDDAPAYIVTSCVTCSYPVSVAPVTYAVGDASESSEAECARIAANRIELGKHLRDAASVRLLCAICHANVAAAGVASWQQ